MTGSPCSGRWSALRPGRPRRERGCVRDARHRELGLTDSEYERIVELLGREPNDVELAMFSLLWSEHCAYKHSRKLLRRLPTEGERVVMGPGENAGAVDVGNGHAVAFKVESHNHPSAVEPFQGAATGVGGILRDVFAIGARPIAVLDSLRFGELASERSRYLFEGAVAGSATTATRSGCRRSAARSTSSRPTSTTAWSTRCASGSRRTEEMVRSAAAGPGNSVVLMGASTGRDGIGGASVLASAELDEGDEAKRPSVQIGDPFEESKLLECCLELLERGLLVSLQDLGAAGLTSSAGEMASRGGVGIDIDVAAGAAARGRHGALRDHGLRVPGADARGGRAGAARRGAWRPASAGRPARPRSAGHRQRPAPGPRDGVEVVGEMPVAALVDDCPLYDLEPGEPEGWIYGNGGDAGAEGARRRGRCCWRCSARPTSPRSAGRSSSTTRWSARAPCGGPRQADAAVLLLPESGNAIAVAIDGNGRRVACDPYAGTVEAVLECAQNLACVGAEPLGLTNCLNFGNPEKPSVAWQLDRAVSGLADACLALGVPVVGGNVSLYNETETARSTRPRWSAWSASCPTRRRSPGIAFAARATRSAWSARSPRPRRLGAGQAARRARAGPAAARRRRRRRGLRDRPRRGPRRQRSPPPTTSATAASPARSPSWRSPAGSAAEVDLEPLRERGCSPEEALFGEGPGGFLVSGDRAALEELGATLLGEVGGDGDRDRRRRPQPRGRPRRRRARLALAAGAGRARRRLRRARRRPRRGRRRRRRRAPRESEAGSPTIATRIAVPSTAPTWRKAALTALAVAKRSSATSRTAAEPRVGKARPMPMPVRTAPGSQRPSQSGSAPAERRTITPAAKTSVPGTITARWPKRSARRPAGPATIVVSAGPGSVASAGAGGRV